MPKYVEFIYNGFWFSLEREKRSCIMAGHVPAIFILGKRLPRAANPGRLALM
jgi:hypothetical protein